MIPKVQAKVTAQRNRPKIMLTPYRSRYTFNIAVHKGRLNKSILFQF